MNCGLRFTAVGLIAMLMIGCSAVTDTQLPDGVESPVTYNNREGATRLTIAARDELAYAIANYIVSSGLLTDELSTVAVPGAGAASRDKRSGHWIGTPPYAVRSLARIARGVTNKYVPGETSAWQALLFMYEAYAEILIADGWCSGTPLSTLDFEGDWTYRAGSTTDEIYAHAILLLDSADTRAADSASLQATIRVLKARAQLAIGRYADAKQTVQSIDGVISGGINGGFQHTMRIAFDDGRLGQQGVVQYLNFTGSASISDDEGRNGLPYRSSRDPRTKGIQLAGSPGTTAWFPVKYVTTDSSTFVLASGIESKLILAEVALHDNDPQQMLTILNALRTTETFTVSTTPLPGGGEQIDTLWHAGMGGVAGLRPFTSLPTTPEAQRKLLFAERAAWLFLTGARQGDLRRLVRKYGLDREQVYPTGPYAVLGYSDVYGTDISFSLNAKEFQNPLFTGCQSDD